MLSLEGALVLAALTGCIDVDDEFTCASEQECVDGAVQGACEADGYCSFPDSTCSGTQRRYAEHSGDRSGSCAGRTFHVAKTGDDANPGTEAAPFATIARGASVLLPGDAVLVHEGTYDEALARIPPGSSWNLPVIIGNNPGDAVTIHAPDPDSRPLTLDGTDQRFIVVAGFRIDAEGSSLEPVRIGADHVRIRDCEIVGSPIHAVLVHDELQPRTFVELIGLNIHENGLALPAELHGEVGGIATSSADNLIERCWVHENRGLAIELYTNEDVEPNPRSTDRTVIRYNRIHDHPEGAMIISGGADVLVFDNLVYRGGSGIDVWWESTNVRVFNNTLYSLQGPDVAGIRVHSQALKTVVRNNVVFFTPDGLPILDDGIDTLAPAEDNYLEDPRFVDADAGDFHLQAGSPAIDIGATLPEVVDDFDGVQRPQGSGYDMGAFEAR